MQRSGSRIKSLRGRSSEIAFGRRSKVNVLSGKNVQKREDGVDIFETYFSNEDEEDLNLTIESTNPGNQKSLNSINVHSPFKTNLLNKNAESINPKNKVIEDIQDVSYEKVNHTVQSSGKGNKKRLNSTSLHSPLKTNFHNNHIELPNSKKNQVTDAMGYETEPNDNMISDSENNHSLNYNSPRTQKRIPPLASDSSSENEDNYNTMKQEHKKRKLSLLKQDANRIHGQSLENVSKNKDAELSTTESASDSDEGFMNNKYMHESIVKSSMTTSDVNFIDMKTSKQTTHSIKPKKAEHNSKKLVLVRNVKISKTKNKQDPRKSPRNVKQQLPKNVAQNKRTDIVKRNIVFTKRNNKTESKNKHAQIDSPVAERSSENTSSNKNMLKMNTPLLTNKETHNAGSSSLSVDKHLNHRQNYRLRADINKQKSAASISPKRNASLSKSVLNDSNSSTSKFHSFSKRADGPYNTSETKYQKSKRQKKSKLKNISMQKSSEEQSSSKLLPITDIDNGGDSEEDGMLSEKNVDNIGETISGNQFMSKAGQSKTPIIGKKSRKNLATDSSSNTNKKDKINHKESSSNTENDCRRSSRTRISPLAYWRNERTRTRFTETGDIQYLGVDKGTSDHLQFTPVKRKLKLHKKSNSNEELATNSEYYREIEVFNPETEETTLADLIRPYKSLTWRGPKNVTKQFRNGYSITKSFISPVASVGFLKLGGNQEKQLQHLPTDDVVFIVMKGKVNVQIYKTKFFANEKDAFLVPKSNNYSIENLKPDEALLSFFTCKYPIHEDEQF